MHPQALSARLGARFCLTFVKRADATEALTRMGAYSDTLSLREPAAPFAAAVELGAWTVVIEPGGALGADDPVLRAASRGSAAVTVLRNDDAEPFFGYAVDGTTIAAFNPGYPADEAMWGADPGQLHHLLPAVGLREPAEDDEGSWRLAVPRAILLAQKITGVSLPADPLAARVLSAQLEPWFVTGVQERDLLRPARRDPQSAELVAAAEAAPPEVQRAVAVTQLRQLAATLGIAEAPGLSEALDAATHGQAEPVAADTPLGRQVRAWLDAGRHRPFVIALRGVLDPDPRTALLAALRPLDRQARADVVAALYG
jgi:uncharacterized protein DUF6461